MNKGDIVKVVKPDTQGVFVGIIEKPFESSSYDWWVRFPVTAHCRFETTLPYKESELQKCQ
jgi:predicted Mrr-cat superfamily restriction endonuclease